jgi:hypothetical protein
MPRSREKYKLNINSGNLLKDYYGTDRSQDK